MTDQRVAKWCRWIDGAMKVEILTMHLHRDTWQQVQQIVRDNGSLPDSYWWEFMRDTYTATQAMGVRRQADVHRDAASLGKLISEISDEAHLITPEFWVAQWPDDQHDRAFAGGVWMDEYGGDVVDHLDPAIPAADLTKLREASEKVTRYVDKHLAHSDHRPLPASELPALDDVHDAIDTIGHLYRKYYSLLTASAWERLVPIVDHDWQAVFRQPWIRPRATG